MELRQLKYFVEVADVLNFSEAARNLFITQGTLSQQIRQLEDELGSPLFARTSHHVMLTEAGKQLLPLAQETMRCANSCKECMEDMRGIVSGTLEVGVTYSFRYSILKVMKRFMKEYPTVKLHVVCMSAPDLFDRLLQHKLDLVLSMDPANPYPELESIFLGSSRLSVVVRKDHPLADCSSLSLDDLKHQDIILMRAGNRDKWTYGEFVGVDMRGLNVRVELTEPDMIFDLLRSTNMISIMSAFPVYSAPDLKAIPLSDVEDLLNGSVHQLRGVCRKKSAKLFIDMLLDASRLLRVHGLASGDGNHLVDVIY